MTRKGFKNVKLGKNVHRQVQRRSVAPIPKVKQAPPQPGGPKAVISKK